MCVSAGLAYGTTVFTQRPHAQGGEEGVAGGRGARGGGEPLRLMGDGVVGEVGARGRGP